MEKAEFERLYAACRVALERFVYYKMAHKADAEDILQEVALAAYKSMDTLKKPESFNAWLIKIAANKCRDFYQKTARLNEIPYDDVTESVLAKSHHGMTAVTVVRDTLDALADKDKQILFLYYFRNRRQEEIAAQLGIPVGTVKSRLHTARHNFKSLYPFPSVTKGATSMKTMPDTLPHYTITPSAEAPFVPQWEELMGWFLVPKLNEKISWAMYDLPGRNRTEAVTMEVLGRASVHGIEGVEIRAVEENPAASNAVNGAESVERTFVAQLTDEHCRILAESHVENGVKKFFTFLDGDDFLPNWGFGENNCGKETHPVPRGLIGKNGSTVTCPADKQVMDIVGRYEVAINGKTHDTVCLIDIELYDSGVFSEQYIDTHGKTVLWRRFNRNDWHFARYQKLWVDILPSNERLTVNGELYVHWYDCITDYIL